MEARRGFGNDGVPEKPRKKVMANAAAATAFTADDSTEPGGSVGTRPRSTDGPPAPGRAGEPLVFAASFGPYRCNPYRRLLLEGETPVRLGSRAFDILV